MPTLAQINAQSNGDLTRVERNHVLEILGVPLDTNNDSYVRAEARFDYFKTLAPDLNRVVRAIMSSYDKIGERMTRIAGGSRGIQANLADDRARQALNLRNVIFPPVAVQPLDNEPQPFIGGVTGGATVHFVPIRYANDDERDDEYASGDRQY